MLNLPDLIRAGVVLIPAGDRLKIKGPEDVLTDDVVDAIRAHKAELLDLLTSGAICRACGHHRQQQDAVSWFCPACRGWSDASGDPLPGAAGPRTMATEAARLVADLTAAGYGFVIDGDELRLSLNGRISTALWARFEAMANDDEFLALAYRAAKPERIEATSPLIH